MKLIDVYEGDDINDNGGFEQLKASGMPIIIKATEGMNYKDCRCDYRAKKCTEMGIPFSFYHMLTKNPDVEGQARDFYNATKDYGNTMLNALDIEYSNIPNKEGYANRFIAEYKRLSGQELMIYSCQSYLQENFSQSFLNSNYLWVANYGGSPKVLPNVVIHQYSDREKLGWVGNGDGCVDINEVWNEDALFKGQSSPVVVNNSTSQPIGGNNIISLGQQHAKNFAGCELNPDGIRGELTRKGAVKVLQHAMNLDYNAGLVEDGEFGNLSSNALSGHTVRQGETQYMVTALEILLMLKGYDPNGVECPGVFGSGLSEAVGKYQAENGLTVDNIAGFYTFKSLIS